ncbi:MAG: hypothetical protein QOD29_3032 [Alphaproteobacteria bacterium]|nr:hypothetical protein [Alphaproteobacteria bacterium]
MQDALAPTTMRRGVVVYASFTIFKFEVNSFLRGDAPLGQLGNMALRKMLQNIRHRFFTRSRRDPELTRDAVPDHVKMQT